MTAAERRADDPPEADDGQPPGRKPEAFAIPRALWTQPVGTIRRGEPLDDLLPLAELTAELRDTSGTVWRWVRLLGRLPWWRVEGSRSMWVRRADAQPWIDEVSPLDRQERRRAMMITKDMRRRRLEALAPPAPPEPAGPPQLPLEVVPVEPVPPVQRGERAMSLHTAAMAYDLPFYVLLRACKGKELPSSWIEGRFYVRPEDMDVWFGKHSTR